MTRRESWVIVASGVHDRGGTDRANAALARHLLDLGAELHLVVHDADPEFTGHPRVTCRRVALPFGVSALTDWALGRAGRQVAARLRETHPHMRVVVNGGNCLWGDVNWVHYLHRGWRVPAGAGPLATRVKDRIVAALGASRERRALAVARCIITNSESTARLVRDAVPSASDRVHCVYLGAEAEWTIPSAAERAEARAWLQADGDRPVVTFLGGLGFDHRKGFDTLWNAWQRLQEQGSWPALLMVAGDGAALNHWRATIAASRWAATVRFLGFTSRVPALLAGTDLLVSPTRYEPFGLNVQEALCRGVPAIVSALAGVAERYPAAARHWLLADPDDANALAASMRRWSNERDEWRATATTFGDMLRAYSWDDMARRMVRVVSSGADAPVPASLS